MWKKRSSGVAAEPASTVPASALPPSEWNKKKTLSRAARIRHMLFVDDSDLLDFTPVPVRARRDGWTPERQRAFIDWLSKGLRPGRAAARVGMSRKSAYALRCRAGAEGFTAAWDAAFDMVRRRRLAAQPPTEWKRAIDGVLRPVRYRGRIVGYDRRFDDVAMLRLLGRLTKLIDNRGKAEGQ